MQLDDFLKMLNNYDLTLSDLDSILQYYNMQGYDKSEQEFEETVKNIILCFVGQLLDYKNKGKDDENYITEIKKLFNI